MLYLTTSRSAKRGWSRGRAVRGRGDNMVVSESRASELSGVIIVAIIGESRRTKFSQVCLQRARTRCRGRAAAGDAARPTFTAAAFALGARTVARGGQRGAARGDIRTLWRADVWRWRRLRRLTLVAHRYAGAHCRVSQLRNGSDALKAAAGCDPHLRRPGRRAPLRAGAG